MVRVYLDTVWIPLLPDPGSQVLASGKRRKKKKNGAGFMRLDKGQENTPSAKQAQFKVAKSEEDNEN